MFIAFRQWASRHSDPPPFISFHCLICDKNHESFRQKFRRLLHLQKQYLHKHGSKWVMGPDFVVLDIVY
jgi:hypothetical protein